MPENGKLPDVTCHRFMVPFSAILPVMNPITKQEQAQEVAKMNFVKCIRQNCAIWDEKKNQCGDKTKNQALDRLAHLMESKENAIQILEDGE